MNQREAWQRYTALITACLLMLSLISLAVWRYRAYEPTQDLALQTLELRHIIDRLEVSLADRTPTSQVVKRYLSQLAAIEKRCQKIEQGYSEITRDDYSTTVLASLTATNELCKDLSTLARNSIATYRPLLPILSINPQLKRYQTLPGIQQAIRSNHLRLVAASSLELRRSPLANNDFPSTSPRLVSELEQVIMSSSTLNYLPTLATTQTQLLTERQQYWTTYGSLNELKRELDIQLERYCALLELPESSPVCRANPATD